jgi:hypothetical protein
VFALDIAPGDHEWASRFASEHVRRARNAISVPPALLARTHPLIVVVEDMHCIDAESQSVLDRLIDGIATQQILLLMTYFNHAWDSGRNYNQLNLDPLLCSESALAARRQQHSRYRDADCRADGGLPPFI